VVTAATMARWKEEEEEEEEKKRMPLRAPWQADDRKVVNLVEESLKLLGQISEKQEKSCHSAYFQGAQQYLEGMAAGEGVG
jgi:hypothetical protein